MGNGSDTRLAGEQGLRARRMGIDTLLEFVVYMHRDCLICRAEGFEAQTRVEVQWGGQSIIATMNVVDPGLISPGDIGLSNSAWHALKVQEGDVLAVSHAPVLESMSLVRGKIYGQRFDAPALDAIVADVAAGRYPDTHIAAFLTACAGGRMDVQETIELTRAMVAIGERLSWQSELVADKHCIGGLPGNRTTPIVVAIAAAAGLTMPKTSSRAITSPAGTADVMETMTPVALDIATMRRVVESEGACLVWGGALALSPADDVLIRVERPLDLDSDSQLVASVLSKKIAAGATHALIDIPVGPTAKVRNEQDFIHLQRLMEQVAAASGLSLRVRRTDGRQPVGRGVGPALEALDVLAVLQNAPDAPPDLRLRALELSAELLEFCGHSRPGQGAGAARKLLESGQAWARFQAICRAQGGLREPPLARLREPVPAPRGGHIRAIDNRRLARLAKLAGAPNDPAAGLELHVRLGERIERGMPLITLHAETRGELAYALQYLATHPPIEIGGDA